jgi:hypothetical protein
MVPKVGVKFCVCNIVGQKVYNIKCTYLIFEAITSRQVSLLTNNKTSMFFLIVRYVFTNCGPG